MSALLTPNETYSLPGQRFLADLYIVFRRWRKSFCPCLGLSTSVLIPKDGNICHHICFLLIVPGHSIDDLVCADYNQRGQIASLLVSFGSNKAHY